MGLARQAPRGKSSSRIWRALLRSAGAGCIALAAAGWLGPSLLGALASPWMVQAWGGLAAVSLLLLLVRAWRSAAVCALALVALTMWVLPVLLPREASGPVRTLRIAYANVNAWNAPSPSSIAWFSASGADVVAIVECSAQWADALSSVAGPGGHLWPHAVIRTDGHPMSGVAVISRHPLRDGTVFVGPEGGFPMVDVTVDAPDGPLRMMVAHPVPPVSADAAMMRDSEIRWLAQRCADSGMPTAIVADFNDTPFGHALADFGARSGMRSAASANGLVTTWPTRVVGIPWPAPLRIAIDHCFVSPSIGIAALRSGPDIGSDHLPLLIDIAHGAANPRTAD